MILFFFLIIFIPGSTALSASVEAEQILHEIDYMYRSEKSYSLVSMSIETPEWKRNLELKIWTKGLDDTLVVVLTPMKEKGIATLKQDNKIWNYLPKIDRLIRLPPSMMMNNWMGSDLTNDDLVKENTYALDYESKLFRKENEFLITLTPKKETVSLWSKIELFTSMNKPWLPKRQIFYNERNEAIREINFSKIETINGKKTPTQISVTPLNKKGHKTILTYKKIDLEPKFPDKVFSLNYMKKPDLSME